MNKKTVKLNNQKGRKISSSRWLNRHLNDIYVTQAKAQGYYARSAYKLIEINEKFRIFKPQQIVIDLGASPGSWSQVVAEHIFNTSNIENNSSQIIAIDLLPIKNLPKGVTSLVADVLNQNTINLIKESIHGKEVNVVISDMAANSTGHTYLDIFKMAELCEATLDLSKELLKSKGSLVTKVFQGSINKELWSKFSQHFSLVKYFKPNSSRKESKEIYIIAKGFKK